MTKGITAYPLCWPPQWPRTHEPLWAPFKRTLAQSRDDVWTELDMLGAQGVIISTNAELLKDGITIAARQRTMEDAGAAVYFDLDGQPRVMPCDKWVELRHNLRAIALTIDALRGIERWGAHEMMIAAFSGYLALPSRSGDGLPWWDVLGVPMDAPRLTIDQAYRARAKEHHPDRPGGDAETFARIGAAYRAALAER